MPEESRKRKKREYVKRDKVKSEPFPAYGNKAYIANNGVYESLRINMLSKLDPKYTARMVCLMQRYGEAGEGITKEMAQILYSSDNLRMLSINQGVPLTAFQPWMPSYKLGLDRLQKSVASEIDRLGENAIKKKEAGKITSKQLKEASKKIRDVLELGIEALYPDRQPEVITDMNRKPLPDSLNNEELTNLLTVAMRGIKSGYIIDTAINNLISLDSDEVTGKKSNPEDTKCLAPKERPDMIADKVLSTSRILGIIIQYLEEIIDCKNGEQMPDDLLTMNRDYMRYLQAVHSEHAQLFLRPSSLPYICGENEEKQKQIKEKFESLPRIYIRQDEAERLLGKLPDLMVMARGLCYLGLRDNRAGLVRVSASRIAKTLRLENFNDVFSVKIAGEEPLSKEDCSYVADKFVNRIINGKQVKVPKILLPQQERNGTR